jgi:broad specificity phosphatase PhoE
MRKHPFLNVIVFALLLLSWSLPCFGQRTIVVVRHADKIDNTDDAVLSPTGEAQAKRLAHALKDLGISAIYTTQFKRTVQTATPLADLLKIKLFAYEQTDVEVS